MPNTLTAALRVIKKEEPTSASSSVRRPSHLLQLPAWPLLTFLYGFPVIWALGIMQFAPIVLGCAMLCYMMVRGNIRLYPALWLWGSLIFWVVVCTLSLSRPSDLIAWGFRFSGIVCAGVFALYYFNARDRITPNRLLGGLSTVWATVVVLGGLALVFPNFRLQTPMSFIMPASIMNNQLARDYMLPPLAEVQKPWGIPEALVRPSGPFPYANSWGLAYAVLTPIVIAYILRSPSSEANSRFKWAPLQRAVDKSPVVARLVQARFWALKILLILLLAFSAIPAKETSNRGMFIGLGLAGGYVLLRLIIARMWLASGIGIAAVAAVVVGLFATGTVSKILGRQEYSDSTGGRAALYQATWEATKQSPLIGYGVPRMEQSIGVSMGTQGYLWTLMFCFGLVGLTIFVLFLLSATLSGLPVRTMSGFLVHAVPVSCLIVFMFYSFDVVQLSVLLLSTAVCIRSIYYKEGL